jgi:D-glycero-D-manno-heptose 1,7-bisphosphate phosphatase
MKFAFLDRDGVINKDIGYPSKIKDITLIEGVIESLKILQKLGFHLVIITNQSGIAKGYLTLKQYYKVENYIDLKLKSNGITIKKTLFCPHHKDGVVKKYKKDCKFRKPEIGMLNYIDKCWGVDRKSSILIGDKDSDLECGKTFGLNKCYRIKSRYKSNSEITYNSLSHIATHLQKT